MIILPFFEIFAPFGSTKKHSSLPLQIDLSTPCSMLAYKVEHKYSIKECEALDNFM